MYYVLYTLNLRKILYNKFYMKYLNIFNTYNKIKIPYIKTINKLQMGL